VKFHEIKADVDHFRVLDARAALETHEADAPRRAARELDLANSLRVLFSLFDDRHPSDTPKS
jgi:hypothetical protein